VAIVNDEPAIHYLLFPRFLNKRNGSLSLLLRAFMIASVPWVPARSHGQKALQGSLKHQCLET